MVGANFLKSKEIPRTMNEDGVKRAYCGIAGFVEGFMVAGGTGGLANLVLGMESQRILQGAVVIGGLELLYCAAIKRYGPVVSYGLSIPQNEDFNY